jgi:hypothetical protein
MAPSIIIFVRPSIARGFSLDTVWWLQMTMTNDSMTREIRSSIEFTFDSTA